MISTIEVGGGGNTRNGPVARKNQPNNQKLVGFKGDAKAERVLHGRFVTNGSNQAGKIIAFVLNLSSYTGDTSFPNWAESIRPMQRKTQSDFMPADVGRSTYGAINSGVFVWNRNALDTEDQYNRDMKIWDRSVILGTSQWNNYVNNGESICLAIQG